nr:endoplasmic reticulum oxidoreductin-1 [Quercus suber]
MAIILSERLPACRATTLEIDGSLLEDPTGRAFTPGTGADHAAGNGELLFLVPDLLAQMSMRVLPVFEKPDLQDQQYRWWLLSVIKVTGLVYVKKHICCSRLLKDLQLESGSKVSDACASYADLDAINNRLQPFIRSLANNSDFFSYYRLNLYNKECPFWNDENGLCGNIACAVTTVENEQDVPAVWKAEELSKLEGPKAQHPGRQEQRERKRPLLGELGDDVGESCVVEYDDECDERDYCVPEDESARSKGDYVSLADNPERFTGYSGEGANQIWEAIYRENCFTRLPKSEHSISVPGLQAPFSRFSSNQAQAAQDLKQVIKAYDRQQAIVSGAPSIANDADMEEDECIEKRVFYRIISGMHASISTHLCHDYLNQTTGEWGPNLECYKDRLHSHPERISNLYFDYALVLRAVGKLKDYVQDYTFCTGDPQQDAQTKRLIRTMATAIPSGQQIFDESIMFQDQTADGLSLKEDFRNRFRNVSRIMDCVGCDKCRLWGKIQTAGFGTALKVLFEFGNDDGESKPLLRRTELVALINTLDKISVAMKALEHFREMMANELDTLTNTNTARTVQDSSKQQRLPRQGSDGLGHADDDFPPTDLPPRRRKAPANQSAGDAFWDELDLVWRTYLYVLKTWASLPKKIAEAIGFELKMLFNAWLGRPVITRTWQFNFKSARQVVRDEL